MPIWMPVVLSTPVWQTVRSTSLTTDSAGWGAGYTLRFFIPQASLLVTGGSLVRITLTAASAVNLVVDDCYLGQASSGYTSSSPAFSGTPTQVKFSTASGVTVTAGASSVSDAMAASIPSANGLLITTHISCTTIRATAANTPSGFDFAFKVGSTDSATVAASGYTAQTGTNGFGIVSLVEVFA